MSEDRGTALLCIYHEYKNCSEGALLSFDDLTENQKLLLEHEDSTFRICSGHLDKRLEMKSIKQRYCCDPLKKHRKVVTISLTNITDELHEIYRHDTLRLVPGRKLCYNCLYKHLPAWLESHQAPIAEPVTHHETPESNLSETPSTDSQNLVQPSTQSSDGSVRRIAADLISETTAEEMNSLFDVLEIDRKFDTRNTSKRYLDDVQSDINESVKKKIRIFEPTYQDPHEKDSDDLQEIVDQLKERLKSCKTNNEKCFVLSVLPKTWSAAEINKRLDVSYHLAEKTRRLIAEKGILYKPSVKCGKKIDPKTVDLIKNFYESDEVSRVQPGKDDSKSYKVDGVRVVKQRRLLLGNLRELYVLFKTSHPSAKVGFSRFAAERPPHCIIAGGSGTHSVCVCKIHQNVKLLLSALNLKKIDPTREWDYKYVLSRLTCDEATEDCIYGRCEACPTIESLMAEMGDLLESNNVDSITYKQWIQTDRCNLETITSPISEVLEKLKEALPTLLQHDYIAKRQSEFLRELKENLPVGHVIVLGDYAENLSFIVQDAVQGYHWSNDQATLHPWVCYYRDENGDLQHLTVITISDCLKHDAKTVYAFQAELVKLLKEKIPRIDKIIYFTDGAGSQYKNRFNFKNLAFHKKDFGVDAEWHFFATSHGKGPCDGIGGTFKRSAAKAILQRIDDPIKSVEDLVAWARQWNSDIICQYVPQTVVDVVKKKLAKRLSQAKVIDGTHKFHSFIPISKKIMRVRTFSASPNFEDVKL